MDPLLEKRSDQLFKLGLKCDGQTFYCKDCKIGLNFHYTDLINLSEDKYQEILYNHKINCKK